MLRQIWFAILLPGSLGGQSAYAAEYEIKMLDNGDEGFCSLAMMLKLNRRSCLPWTT